MCSLVRAPFAYRIRSGARVLPAFILLYIYTHTHTQNIYIYLHTSYRRARVWSGARPLPLFPSGKPTPPTDGPRRRARQPLRDRTADSLRPLIGGRHRYHHVVLGGRVVRKSRRQVSVKPERGRVALSTRPLRVASKRFGNAGGTRNRATAPRPNTYGDGGFEERPGVGAQRAVFPYMATARFLFVDVPFSRRPRSSRPKRRGSSSPNSAVTPPFRSPPHWCCRLLTTVFFFFHFQNTASDRARSDRRVSSVHQRDPGRAPGHFGLRQIVHLRLRVRHARKPTECVRQLRFQSCGRRATRVQRHSPRLWPGKRLVHGCAWV